MNTVRATVWLCYVMIGLVVLAAGASIWDRPHDPMWSQMGDSRRNYDLIQGCVVGYALAVAYGLWRRREWGRVFAISLAAIVLFMFVGTRLLAPLLTSGDVGITLDWDTIVMGVLSSACIVALSRRRFRHELTANHAFESGRAKSGAPAQRER